MEEWRQRDAILTFEKRLVENGVLAPQDIETTRNEVDKRVHAAVDKARQEPFPDVNEVTDHVYA